MTVKTNFFSTIRNADGLLLENEIFFNNTIDEVIKKLESFKTKYPNYDWLELENDHPNGYCLVGYIRTIKEHDMVVLDCGIPYTSLREGDKGAVVHIYNTDNTYEVEFEDGTIVTVKAIEITKLK